MEKEKKKSLSFRIKQIKTLKFSIDNVLLESDKVQQNFEFEILPASFINVKLNEINIKLSTRILQIDDKKTLCDLEVLFIFETANLEDFAEGEKKDTVAIPDTIMQTLIGISASTLRGILFVKTEGTLLNNIYMPIINPQSFRKIQEKEDNQANWE